MFAVGWREFVAYSRKVYHDVNSIQKMSLRACKLPALCFLSNKSCLLNADTPIRILSPKRFMPIDNILTYCLSTDMKLQAYRIPGLKNGERQTWIGFRKHTLSSPALFLSDLFFLNIFFGDCVLGLIITHSIL